MQEKLKKILDKMHEYNSEQLAYHTFGVTKNIVYDALVMAPGWKQRRYVQIHLFISQFYQNILTYLVI